MEVERETREFIELFRGMSGGKSAGVGGGAMAKTVNVYRVFEAIARIVTQREEGVKVTLLEVQKVDEQETAGELHQEAV